MNTKKEIREYIWNFLEENKLGRFPFPLKNRIPNFKGAEKAAAFVFTMPEYKKAKVIKVNPDSPQAAGPYTNFKRWKDIAGSNSKA